MLLDEKSARQGGNSLARNGSIFRMFNLIGYADRSGWGIPYLDSFSMDYSGVPIQIKESVQPDRTTLIVPLYETKRRPLMSFESFLEQKKPGERFTREEIASCVHLSTSGLSKKLADAIAGGRILRGEKRGLFIKL